MNSESKLIIILVADDDPDDRFMMKESFEDARLANPLHFVENGEELLDYLKRKGKYTDLVGTPLPGIILLDLNMPRMDGREALKEIKGDPNLMRIPIIVFTTSKSDEDVYKTYGLGVNSFISKPVTFESLVEVVKTLSRYWLEIVELPNID